MGRLGRRKSDRKQRGAERLRQRGAQRERLERVAARRQQGLRARQDLGRGREQVYFHERRQRHGVAHLLEARAQLRPRARGG